ncbi:MAG: hypothetical protein ACW99G_06135 [Candidatus Thorarchaeota archaeon]|jgi:hypothetical protein
MMAISQSVQTLYNGALAVIKDHNENLANEVTPETPGYVDPDKFIQCLKASGGTSDDRLKKLKYEDILVCLPETNGVKPTIIAKEIAGIFRGYAEHEQKHDDALPRPVSKSKASKMSLRELLECYDPKDSSNSVAKRLKEISKEEPCIVFNKSGSVNIDVSVKLIQEVRDGYNGREYYTVDGNVFKVHKIGWYENNNVEENPIYRGRPLRPDGTCDILNRKWEGIPKDVRQFIAFALKHPDGPHVGADVDKAHTLFNMAKACAPQFEESNATAKQALYERYPSVAIDFDRAMTLNELPSLMIPLEEARKNISSGNPFDNGKKVKYGRGHGGRKRR